MTPAWARGLIAIALLTPACAPRLMKLPTGPGTPAADGPAALAEATKACRAVGTFTAELGVSGSVGGQRLRVRISAGLAPPASARLEAVAPFGAPFFVFAARDDEATLLLPRDDRVLRNGRSDAVLEALTGVPLDAAGLRQALTGCASPAADGAGAREAGADWRIVPDAAGELYLHRDRQAGRWRLVAATRRGDSGGEWRAEYSAFQSTDLPQAIRFISGDRERFDLRLALAQVDVNTPLGPEVFQVEIPRTAQPITLTELRDARPGVRKD